MLSGMNLILPWTARAYSVPLCPTQGDAWFLQRWILAHSHPHVPPPSLSFRPIDPNAALLLRTTAMPITITTSKERAELYFNDSLDITHRLTARYYFKWHYLISSTMFFATLATAASTQMTQSQYVLLMSCLDDWPKWHWAMNNCYANYPFTLKNWVWGSQYDVVNNNRITASSWSKPPPTWRNWCWTRQDEIRGC